MDEGFISGQRWREVTVRHDWEDYWYSGGAGRGGGSPWSSSDDPVHLPGWRTREWQFYANGPDGHRPAWEDMILARIDGERQAERDKRERESREIARALEAGKIRAVRLSAQRRGLDEARKILARNARHSGGYRVRSWHAPRTPEGLPEGVEAREES